MNLAAAALLSLLCAQPLSRVRVAVVADDPGKPYLEARRALNAAGATADDPLAPDSPGLAAKVADAGAGVSVWLALGPRSARALASCRTKLPRAAALVRAADAPVGLSVVSLDVPLEQQLKWLATAFPDRSRLVVLRHPDQGASLSAAAQQACANVGLKLDLRDVREAGEAVPALEQALGRDRRSSLVWLLPDPVAVGPDTLAELVQTALKLRVPVAGFSGVFLRAGALAAVVSDPGASAVQAVTDALKGRAGVQAPASARLEVDGRRAERLEVEVRDGPGVQVKR